ncbi:MAG: alanine dehydrogenase [Desulfonauticus sp.]|nr:alanine dehydrogenase [Desulfonauticus sp.]
MLIGCPKEVKNNEFRVGLTPAAVKAYTQQGHTVFIQQGAGTGSGISDEEFKAAGASILPTAEEVWDKSEMIVKVKEPMPQEYDLMKEGQIIYTYFHFAADAVLTKTCLEKKIIAIAYETVQEDNGNLPLLKPMSEVAGRMSALMAAFYLAKPQHGRGVLPTGVPGVLPANVVVIGGGTVGSNAARIAAGLGAKVIILDINTNTLEHLGNIMPANVFTCFSDPVTLERCLIEADIVIGAVLIPGAKAPKIITRSILQKMKPGAVFVDVAIDQGGCAETSRPTTHDNPIFIEENIVHYCVANMPGAYARSSTFALNNVTIKYGLKIANLGVEKACKQDPHLRKGLNMYKGILTCPPVSQAFGLENQCKYPEEILN